MKALQHTEHRVLIGDCREQLRSLADARVHCCVTSPPYWGLRSYLPDDHPDKARELGTEATPDEYVAHMVEVFREVRRVLRDDGVLWLNLGDCYAGAGYSNHKNTGGAQRSDGGKRKHTHSHNLKPKDLVGIPWRVAFALQADGWWLRSDVIWAKSISGAYRGGSCMPESVTDRPTRAHEYLFLLAKSERYYFDQDAVREDAPHPGCVHTFARPSHTECARASGDCVHGNELADTSPHSYPGRNIRSVWHHSPQPFPGAHFAVMPPALVLPCVLAGTSARGCCSACGAPWERSAGGSEATCNCPPGEPVPCVVLDPFAGAGTTGLASKQLGRSSVSIELKEEYAQMAERRLLTGSTQTKEAPAADWFVDLCSGRENST